MIISPTAISPFRMKHRKTEEQPKAAEAEIPEEVKMPESKKATFLVAVMTWFKQLIHK